MSNSYKKTPIGGNAGGSDKKDKKISNKKFRKRNKNILKYVDDEILFKKVKEVAPDYDFKKDGKQWFGTPHKRDEYFYWTENDIRKAKRK